MSAGGDSNNPQDFNLNLAPIIDCFTVLITYLLVSASFLTLAALEVGVASQTEASSSPDQKPKPEFNLEVRGKQIAVRIKLGLQTLFEKTFATENILEEIKSVQQRYPQITEVNVSGSPQVIYKELVESIEKIKKVFPKVFLSEG